MSLPHHEVSRIEGFSDAVFGFALTLLVVSLDVPADYQALAVTLSGFLPFAVTFSLIVWIWYEHYMFFRRFGLDDGLTIFLNAVLLFVVLFFVYPMKFVFSNVIPIATGIGLSGAKLGFAGMTPDEARDLMMVYSAGFATVFVVFAVLHWNVYRQRRSLPLDAAGRFTALAGIRTHALTVVIAATSIALAATVPGRWLWVSGVLYSLLGPVHGVNGYLIGRARARTAPSSTPEPR